MCSKDLEGLGNFTQSYLKKPLNHLPQHLYTSKLITFLYLIEVLLAFVFFYPNYKKDDTNILKQSLSKCLAQYYPLAGRIPSPPEPYINCNDEGVEFLEAFNDSPLDDFIHKNVQDEFIDQLFPYGLTCTPQASSPLLLKVQLNHFSGGGAAVALSMSHKFADGATIANFVNHWATVARCGSPINPCFISSSKTDNTKMSDFNVNDLDKGNYVTRRFVFPNSKLQELKTKVIAMGTAPINPTRVEVVTSLLFKHAVSAATTSSGSLKPSNLTITVNMRNKFVENYPETAAGNLSMYGVAKMGDSGKIKLGEVIARIRKAKMELEGIKDEQELVQKFANAISNLQGDLYYITSVCRVPFYQVDFGWGKPVEVIIRFPNVGKNVIVLMDTASGDGIMANVQLPEEEMVILQKDKEFLTYVKDV
ncbi:acylsugar acyltransferase 3 [Lactuca sativa]|uniref:acylsugar acyltransferase 3 n=1 Tax=Lactuca sativa TaxID=4236 RepID=UPI001C68D8F9|nr:acylsugar acyltransferase 3 [Lactuca sativa]